MDFEALQAELEIWLAHYSIGAVIYQQEVTDFFWLF